MSSARIAASLSFAAFAAFVFLPACGDDEIVPGPDSGVLTVACDAKSCECPEGQTCKMTCKAGESCFAKCQKGATCDVDCGSSTDCGARCFADSKGTIRRAVGASPTITAEPTGDCKACLGECTK